MSPIRQVYSNPYGITHFTELYRYISVVRINVQYRSSSGHELEHGVDRTAEQTCREREKTSSVQFSLASCGDVKNVLSWARVPTTPPRA